MINRSQNQILGVDREEARQRLFACLRQDASTGCIIWDGTLNRTGYGVVPLGRRGLKMIAHRLAYELAIGPIGDGLQIDHLCRNRRCCNPIHLEAVTPRENLLRSEAPSAINARKTVCPRGHPYSDENTSVTARGSRRCRECNRIDSRLYALKRKGVVVAQVASESSWAEQ